MALWASEVCVTIKWLRKEITCAKSSAISSARWERIEAQGVCMCAAHQQSMRGSLLTRLVAVVARKTNATCDHEAGARAGAPVPNAL